MKRLLVICLGVLISTQLVLGSPLEEFALADRVGEPNARTFFLFSTSAGNYAVRQDGMGEFTSPKGMRRVFNLRVAGRGRINSIYFIEHNDDLMLLYEVVGQGSYLVRMEQTKRKLRWSTPLQTSNVQAPVIEGDLVVIKEDGRSIAVSKADGKVIRPE